MKQPVQSTGLPEKNEENTEGNWSRNLEDFVIGNTLFIIHSYASGNIRLSYELSNDFSYTFAIVQAVSILGETEFFMKTDYYRAAITCATACSYIVFPKSLFLSWMHSDNDALFFMASFVTEKYSTQVYQDRVFLSASGENRFIYLLVKYYQVYQKNGECRFDTPKEFLADEICVSKKTISRCISEFKTQGLISTNGHYIVIEKEQYEKLLEMYNASFNRSLLFSS